MGRIHGGLAVPLKPTGVPLRRRLSTAEFEPEAPTATTRPSGSRAPAAA